MSQLAPPEGCPSTAARRTRHEDDLYTWVEEQVALLRAGQVDGLDLQNLAEELQDLGAEQYDKLESAFRVLLAHMLKWDHQPERRSRSWDNTIDEQRDRVRYVLQRNPGLKSRFDEALRRGYAGARRHASTETGRDRDVFPVECPYSVSDILEREFRYIAPEPAKSAR
jgi:hypothetical protein